MEGNPKTLLLTPSQVLGDMEPSLFWAIAPQPLPFDPWLSMEEPPKCAKAHLEGWGILIDPQRVMLLLVNKQMLAMVQVKGFNSLPEKLGLKRKPNLSSTSIIFAS